MSDPRPVVTVPTVPTVPTARTGAPWWIPFLVGAIALVLRLVRLGSPDVYVFDEIYYVGDAASLLRSGVERGTPAHPPLGKWLIALGIQAFGMNPTGWRVSAALAGAVLCALVAVIAWRLTRRADLALLGGVLASVDGILFTSSRVAMLDIFEALFVTLAVHACVVALQSPQSSRSQVIRRWHLLAAVWLGLGAAVKWSALFTVPVLIVVVAVQLGRGPAAPERRRALAILIRLTATGSLTIASYLLAYAPTFVAHPDRASPVEFLRMQLRLLEFHLRLTPSNAYAHPAVDWLAQRYPAGLFGERCRPAMGRVDSAVCPSGRSHDVTVAIVSVANPVVWVLGIVALAVLVGSLIYRAPPGAWLVGGAILSRWAPWLVTRDGYSFYAAPLMPVLILAIVLAICLLPARAIRGTAIAIGLVAVAAFAFFYPYWAAVPLSDHDLHLRQWMSTWP
jgi:dolichyl-phosphate-mannose-protein mannosyltransferase